MQFLIYSAAIFLLDLSGVLGLEEVSNSLSFIRLQRSIYSTVNDGSSLLRRKRQISCVNECLINGLAAEVDGMDLSSGSLNPDLFFDTEKLESFCSSVENVKVCLGKCANNQITDMMKLTMETFDGICINNRKEFESFIPCYKRMVEVSETRCDPRCGGKAAMKKILGKLPMATLLGDIDQLSDLMGQSCSLVSCQKTCEAEIIGEKCENSSRAADFLKELGISQFEQMKDMFQSMGISRYWPQECTKVVEQFSPVNKTSTED